MRKILSVMLSILVIVNLLAINTSAISISSETASSMSKISDSLVEKMELVNSTDEIPVQLWLKELPVDEYETMAWEYVSELFEIPGLTESNLKTLVSSSEKELLNDIVQTFIKTKRELLKDSYAKFNQAHITSLGITDVAYVSQYAPLIIADMTKAEIMSAVRSSSIQMITLYEECAMSVIPNDDQLELQWISGGNIEISDSDPNAHISQSDFLRITDVKDEWSLTGEGVKVGIFDSGIPYSELNTVYGFNIICHPNYSQIDTHATDVAYICGTLAPEASYYCIGGSSTDVENPSKETYLTWLCSQNVAIVNMSLEYGSGIEEYTSEASALFDYYSRTYDMLFVFSAGNLSNSQNKNVVFGDPRPMPSSSLAYNAIVVANYDHNNTLANYSDDQIYVSDALYNSSPTVNAYKPDICAPGVNLKLVFRNRGSGTSFSAPHVTAIATLLCEQDPTLQLSPVALKSILMAGVSKASNHHYTPDTYSYAICDANGNPNGTYRLYGAGLVDAYNSCCIAYEETSTYRTRTMGPNETNYEYTVTWHPAYGEIRVCLAYEQMAYQIGDGEYDTGTLPDMDFAIYDPNGTMVASSTTIYNNVEIVDFIPTVSGQYRIRIICSNPSAVSIPYAVSWSQSNN